MAKKMVLSEVQHSSDKGIICRHCGCRHMAVYRTVNHHNMIVRYRKCRHCSKTITSIERIVAK